MAFAAIAWLARQQWFYRAFGFEYQARLCRGKCRSGDVAVCVAGGNDQFLVFAVASHLVAPFRIRGGRIRPRDNGRGAVADSSTAQTDRKKPEQSHAPSALQQLLLLASDPARTGTRAANSGLAQAEASVLRARPNNEHRRLRRGVSAKVESVVLNALVK